ncbi:hypothetical protein [Dyadobacter sp. CY343]|uniref:hypothetical protein n=1 Tax=Dyadobacter sp. CY343 TaxID=2907299 RepID=UPI001F2A34B8|nr:hypothetical protein [Dyadobacter sp. CY343]MCE7060722.1 hypothetical protein [Dyadobacter sp. CY343]
MFSARFPDATETTIKIVEKDKFWEANYKVNNQRFYAGMDSLKILRRSRLEDVAVPDSIRVGIDNSMLAGVEISDYRDEVESFHRPYRLRTARYRFQDKEYLLNWVENEPIYMIRSEPFYKFEYPINSKADLPEKIRSVMDAEPILHIGGLIFIDEKNEKRYQLNASNGDGLPGGDYVFDNDQNLISVSYKPAKTLSGVDELPDHVKQYLDQLNAQYGFTFQLGYQMRITNGYWFYLSNSNRESLELILDENAKELERFHTKYVN